MAADPARMARRQRRFDRYERLSTTPLLINGFVFVGAFLAVLTVPDEPFAPTLITATWMVFIVDYVVMVCLAPHRLTWIVKHVYYAVGIVFPPFRVILLVQVVDRAMRSRNSPLRDKVGLTMAYVTAVIVVFGGYFVWQMERNQPGATISTYGESLWWAVVTITTVGYGDYTPVTLGGRIIATVVLFNGIVAIGVLSGVVVSYFSADQSRRRRQASGAAADSDTTAGDAASGSHLAAIEHRLAGIEAAVLRHLPAGSKPPPDPGPRITEAGSAMSPGPAATGSGTAASGHRDDRHDAEDREDRQ